MLKIIFDGICDLVYPPCCLICKKLSRLPGPGVCLGCRNQFVLNTPPFCPKCSRPLLGKRPGSRCQDCQRYEPAFDFAWSACIYEGQLQNLMHQFKYNQKTYLRTLFVDLILDHIKLYQLDINQFDAIVPIPLSATRRRERGYNQAELLSVGISRHFQIPHQRRNLIRRRHTESQVALSVKNRWTNIKHAFTIINSLEIKNKSILVVDDLLTTGATASEAAQTLKLAGARTVGVLTLATVP